MLPTRYKEDRPVGVNKKEREEKETIEESEREESLTCCSVFGQIIWSHNF